MNEKFEKKIRTFKSRIEMFGPDRDYDQVAAFICGLDYATDGTLLGGFREWLHAKYNIKYSQFGW